MAQARARRGAPLPQAILERPERLKDTTDVWNCWWTLNALRNVSGLLGSLPLSVADYMDAHQVPAEARPRWIRQLVALERTYRSHVLRPPSEAKPDGSRP